jgi:hypothetical protein
VLHVRASRLPLFLCSVLGNWAAALEGHLSRLGEDATAEKPHQAGMVQLAQAAELSKDFSVSLHIMSAGWGLPH